MPERAGLELQPEPLEVLQAEATEPDPPIRVDVASVESPVRTQSLPRKAGATRTREAVGTTPLRVLAPNHSRAQATVMSIGASMRFALSAAMAQDPSTMALWPQNVPYVLTANTELWVCADAGTTDISVVQELWATGELS